MRDQPTLPEPQFPKIMRQIISFSHFPPKNGNKQEVHTSSLTFRCIEYTLKGEKLAGNMLGKENEAPHKQEVSGSKAPYD